MAYSSDIPQANDDPSQSQSQLLGNFQAINTFFSVNHVAPNDGDEGKHKWVSLPEQGAAPSTAVNEIALYSKEVSSTTQLFYRKEADGAEVQLTGNSTPSTNGQVFVGGITIKWGTLSGGSSVVTFSTPFSSSIFNISVTTVAPVASNLNTFGVVNGSATVNGFTIFGSGTPPSSFYWMAIGV